MADQEFDKDFINQVNERINKLVVNRADGILLTAHNILTLETPVDTGQARASWNVSLNTPNFSIPVRPAKDSEGNIVGGRLTASSAKPDAPMTKIGQKYFLVSAVQHMIPLNEGHSQQRAAGFIERGVYKAVKKFD